MSHGGINGWWIVPSSLKGQGERSEIVVARRTLAKYERVNEIRQMLAVMVVVQAVAEGLPSGLRNRERTKLVYEEFLTGA